MIPNFWGKVGDALAEQNRVSRVSKGGGWGGQLREKRSCVVMRLTGIDFFDFALEGKRHGILR